ncbi:uncharacterized protein N7479_006808 [Penicillium vulpinum]|uniref:uncharacterized protein n=1 Tax=Penicillium vulpinum TaxID=29845 RepID=UPI002546AD9B|nr:uncharacterized protein N7479_006808 [Penicillium vulpinum]KAJ5959658.1 hypothetical protein N7479_006808 [Penicillium vulpinum]
MRGLESKGHRTGESKLGSKCLARRNKNGRTPTSVHAAGEGQERHPRIAKSTGTNTGEVWREDHLE